MSPGLTAYIEITSPICILHSHPKLSIGLVDWQCILHPPPPHHPLHYPPTSESTKLTPFSPVRAAPSPFALLRLVTGPLSRLLAYLVGLFSAAPSPPLAASPRLAASPLPTRPASNLSFASSADYIIDLETGGSPYNNPWSDSEYEGSEGLDDNDDDDGSVVAGPRSSASLYEG